MSGELTLEEQLDGPWPESVPNGSSMQVVAALPDGRIEPLLWLYEYKTSYRHRVLLRKPMEIGFWYCDSRRAGKGKHLVGSGGPCEYGE